MIKATRWWWIRHAPSAGDQGIIHGQDDVAANLSDAQALAALNQRLPANSHLFSSNIRRTIETAEAVTGRAPIQIAEFAEQSFGDWNGGKWRDLPREEMNAFWTNYAEQKAPAGESFRELTERVHPKILQMSADYRDQDLVVVAHAGTIRAALALALETPLNAALNMAISNLSLTRIDAFPDENPYAWRVDGTNLPAA